MKTKFVFIIFIPFIMTTSCNSTFKKRGFKNLKINWSIAGNIPNNSNGRPSLGFAGMIAGISHNMLILGGGANFPGKMPWDDGKKMYYDSLYIFEKKSDSLVALKQVFQLPYPLAYSANISTSEGIIAAGGENNKGPINKVLLIKWNDSLHKPEISLLPNLPQPLTNCAAAFHSDQVYITGGQTDSSVSDEFYFLNLKDTTKCWQTLPNLPKPVSHAVLYVQGDANGDTCIYLVGGRREIKDSTSDLYNEVYQFDLKTNKWSLKASLPYTLSAFAGVSWGDGSFLTFSGDEGKTFHATEILSMKIAHAKNPVEKQKLITEKNELQKAHPGYNGNVLLYNTHTNKWMKTDSIPFPGQVTTTAVKWGNEIVIPCGEVKAGLRTPNIIVGKIEH